MPCTLFTASRYTGSRVCWDSLMEATICAAPASKSMPTTSERGTMMSLMVPRSRSRMPSSMFCRSLGSAVRSFTTVRSSSAERSSDSFFALVTSGAATRLLIELMSATSGRNTLSSGCSR